MSKAWNILVLCAVLFTGCGNASEPAVSSETSTVSQTTSAVQATEQSTTTTTTTTEGIPEVTETCSEVISSVTTVTETNTATEEIPNDTKSTTTTASVQEEETPAVGNGGTGRGAPAGGGFLSRPGLGSAAGAKCRLPGPVADRRRGCSGRCPVYFGSGGGGNAGFFSEHK